MSSTSDSSTNGPLQAAQKIVSDLAGLTPENQSLAVKFAVETLGIRLPAALSPIAGTSPHSQHLGEVRPQSSSTDHSTDIRSFTEMKAPNSDQQFAAVVAYFYQFEAKPDSRRDVIDAETMKEAARLAGRPQVTRWNMTLTNAKNAGYLDGAGNGKYKLSSVGENLVAITLPGDIRQMPSKNKSKGAKKKAVKKPDAKKKSKA